MVLGDSLPIPGLRQINIALSIARLAGVDIPGIGDILGGLGGIFGGAEHRGVPVGGRSIDQDTISPFLQSLQSQTDLVLNVGARDFRRYRNTGPLTQQNIAAINAINFTIKQLEALGAKEVADQLRSIRNKDSKPPFSPQSRVDKTDAMLEALNLGNLFLDDMFKSTNAFPDIVRQIRLEQEKFVAGAAKYALKSKIEVAEIPERTFLESQAWDDDDAPYANTIAQRSNLAYLRGKDIDNLARLRGQDAEFQKIIDTPNITTIRPVFSDYYSSITSGEPFNPPIVEPAVSSQQRIDNLFGSESQFGVDTFDLESDEFIAAEQAKTELVTAQQQLAALQADDTATQGQIDEAQSGLNLSIAGFLTGALALSGSALFSGLSEVSNIIQDDLNINLRSNIRPDLKISPDLSISGLLSRSQQQLPQQAGLLEQEPFKPIQPVIKNTDLPIKKVKREPVGFPVRGAGLLAA